MSEKCRKLAFTHPIVVLKKGVKNNWMKKLDRLNRPSESDSKTNMTRHNVLAGWSMWFFNGSHENVDRSSSPPPPADSRVKVLVLCTMWEIESTRLTKKMIATKLVQNFYVIITITNRASIFKTRADGSFYFGEMNGKCYFIWKLNLREISRKFQEVSKI